MEILLNHWTIMLLMSANLLLISLYLIFLLTPWKNRRHPDLEGRVIATKLIPEHVQNFWFYLTEPFVSILIRLRVTPNTITIIGFVLTAIAGYTLAISRWGLGGWLLILAVIFDLFDGRVARKTNHTSEAGAFLDSIIDRYSDGAILIGIAYALRENTIFLLITLIAFVGFFTVSYNRAKSELLGIPCDVGVFKRPERFYIIIVASLFTPAVCLKFNLKEPILIKGAIVLLAVGTIWTSIQRAIYTMKHINLKQK